MTIEQTPDHWTEAQQELFVRLFRHMAAHQALFLHPGVPPIPDELWATTCWNAAWMAARFSIPDAPLALHTDENGTVIAAEVLPGDMN